jgi:hypothetical protein
MRGSLAGNRSPTVCLGQLPETMQAPFTPEEMGRRGVEGVQQHGPGTGDAAPHHQLADGPAGDVWLG